MDVVLLSPFSPFYSESLSFLKDRSSSQERDLSFGSLTLLQLKLVISRVLPSHFLKINRTLKGKQWLKLILMATFTKSEGH